MNQIKIGEFLKELRKEKNNNIQEEMLATAKSSRVIFFLGDSKIQHY